MSSWLAEKAKKKAMDSMQKKIANSYAQTENNLVKTLDLLDEHQLFNV